MVHMNFIKNKHNKNLVPDDHLTLRLNAWIQNRNVTSNHC